MIGKFGILLTILILVLFFSGNIPWSWCFLKRSKLKPETKRYFLKSVNILLIIIAVVGSVLVHSYNLNQRLTPLNECIIKNINH